MKKLFVLLIMFLGINCAFAEETCNSYYKVNINLEGKGTIKAKFSDKVYEEDSTINVKCTDSFVFNPVPEEGYILKGVYINGNHITAGDHQLYGLYDVSSNSNIKVVFEKDTAKGENVVEYSSFENSISLYINDLKEEMKDDGILSVSLREVTILFDKAFVKGSSDNITIVAGEIYKDDLNYKEQKAASNSLYYEFKVYNGESLANNIDGKVTIIIPYSKSDKAYVYKVDKSGSLTKIKNTYDKETVSFDVTESGTYALSAEQLNEMALVKSIIDSNNKKTIAIIGIGFVLSCLVLLIISIKKRK